MADTVRYNALSENYSYSQVNIEKSLVAGASLQVEGLTVSFGSGNHRVLALDGLGFSLKPGEIGSLLGASGCGKTTALRAIAGFVRPQRGRILIGQREVVSATVFVPPEK